MNQNRSFLYPYTTQIHLTKIASHLLATGVLTCSLSVTSAFAIGVNVKDGINANDTIEEVFVTAFRSPVSVSDYAGNITVIDQQTLQEQAASHIQQALARVPGVDFHRNSGQEYLPAVRSPVLTGAGACGSFLIAEDGIPLRPAGFCNVNELFESHWQQAQSVEVIRGPSAALYGTNALHGIINVRTPDPGNQQTRIGLDVGSLDYYQTHIAHSSEQLALSTSVTDDQGFRDDYRVEQQKLSGKYRWASEVLSVTSGMTMVNLNQETAGFIEGTNAYKDTRIARSNQNPEAYRDAYAVRAWTRIENEDSGWVVTPFARKSQMDFLQHFLPGTPLEENGQTSLGVQSSWRFERGDNQLIVGIDGEWADGWLKQSQQNPTEGSDFLQETIPQGQHYDYTVISNQLSPFAHWQHRINERLQLGLGLRYEWLEYDYDNRLLDGRTRDDGSECGFGGCRYSRPADSTDSFENLSPKLSLAYQLAPEHSLFASLARGYRAPQAVELYRLQREQQITDLDSEQLDSLELGVRHQGQQLQYELVAFAQKKRHLIYRDSDFFTIADGRSKHWGLELALAYAINPSVAVRAAVTRARHQYDHNDPDSGIVKGNDIDTAPHHFGNLTLAWTPSNAIKLDLEWQRLGGYYTDPENQHSYSGHNLINLYSHFAISSKVTLGAQVQNLTDRRYADRADYTSFSGDRYLPGAPRSVLLSVTLDW